MIEQEEKIVLVNACTYFMLPMLQLNKSSFGVGNFINSYIDKSGYIVVDIKKEGAGTSTANNTYNHPQYVTDYDVENAIRIVYQVPTEFLADVRVFGEGKYSEFSPELKVLISKYANLNAQDIHIKCLNPQLADREKIANELHVKVELIRELKSAPGDSNYIKIK